MTIDEKLKNIKVTWKTLPYPEIKRQLQTLYHDDMSFLDLVSALYWDLVETKHRYAYDSVKFGNNIAALEEIKELKDELNGWQDDPFSIIAECCEQNPDCKSCHWFEKCPFKDYSSISVEAADVQAVRHGRWENEYLDDDVWWADCTNCKNDTHSKYGRVSTYAYCPNCGARMDGEQNER